MTGPRVLGSAAPQLMATGLGPWRPGWEARTILGCFGRTGRVGRGVVDTFSCLPDIQVASGCRSHLVVTFFQRVQNSTPGRPVMSPAPHFESLAPPNEKGSRGTGTPTLMPT